MPIAPSIGAFFLMVGVFSSSGYGQSLRSVATVTQDSSQRGHNAVIQGSDWKYLLGAVALVSAAAVGDRAIERRFLQQSVQTNEGFRRTSDAAGVIGDPGSIVFSAGTYFIGLGTHSRSIAALGMYTGEAVVLGGVVAEAVKGLAGRSRPKVDTAQVRSFHFGRGFSNDDYGSFPSAETTITFAAATASSMYVRRQWPSASRIVTPAAYAAATLVGISRIYKNEHWASDVAAGAVIGSVAGVGFDRWNRAHPNNIFERVFLPRSFSAARGRATALWSFEFR